MQSNSEIHLNGTLRLIVTMISNRAGQGHYPITTILSSELINKKKRRRVDLYHTVSNLCFGEGLLVIMAPRKPPNAEIMHGARQLYKELEFLDEKKMLSGHSDL